MNFEQANRRDLKNRLTWAGWRRDYSAVKNIAGQLHSFYRPLVRSDGSIIPGGLIRRTLRNAAIIEGLVTR